MPREGMFQACVQHAVPVVLAGSIRDDGPLPDTEMDLIRVQAAYAEVLRGAEMRWGFFSAGWCGRWGTWRRAEPQRIRGLF